MCLKNIILVHSFSRALLIYLNIKLHENKQKKKKGEINERQTERERDLEKPLHEVPGTFVHIFEFWNCS